MVVYVIIKWMGNSWQMQDIGFCREDKARAYIGKNTRLRYEAVTIDVDCG